MTAKELIDFVLAELTTSGSIPTRPLPMTRKKKKKKKPVRVI